MITARTNDDASSVDDVNCIVLLYRILSKILLGRQFTQCDYRSRIKNVTNAVSKAMNKKGNNANIVNDL